jgi:exodeoxyribonuclease VII small subunit
MAENEQSFEKLMAELETLVARLEGEQLSLDEAIDTNEAALKLIQLCHQRLDSAKQRIEKLNQTAGGDWQAESRDPV